MPPDHFLKMSLASTGSETLEFVKSFFPKVLAEMESDTVHQTYLQAVQADYKQHAITWGEKYLHLADFLGITALTNPMKPDYSKLGRLSNVIGQLMQQEEVDSINLLEHLNSYVGTLCMSEYWIPSRPALLPEDA